MIGRMPVGVDEAEWAYTTCKEWFFGLPDVWRVSLVGTLRHMQTFPDLNDKEKAGVSRLYEEVKHYEVMSC